MAYVDFVMKLHKGTQRDYLKRVNEIDKAVAAELAIQWGKDYWDGDRTTGYGGYKYDGRWKPIAQAMIEHYHLTPKSKILDVGCGKGFLLHEFAQLLPGVEVAGLDISEYAVVNAKEEVKPFLKLGNANALPYPDDHFDFVYSITTLHNLRNFDLYKSLQEIERVTKPGGSKHVIVETYRNEREKVNLMYWQLTCRSFYMPDEWEWFFKQANYTGDHSFIWFE